MLNRRYLKYLPLVIAAAGIAALLGTRSFADTHAMGPEGGHGHWGRGMIQEMDANKDGKVTQAEVETFQAARAAEIDANHDGKITADEIQAFREKERAKREAAKARAHGHQRRRQRERSGIRGCADLAAGADGPQWRRHDR